MLSENITRDFFKHRVALVTNQATPYRAAFLESVHRACKLKVFYCCGTEDNRDWGQEHIKERQYEKVLSGFSVAHKDSTNFYHVNPSALWEILKFKPDSLVITGIYPTQIIALMAGLLLRCKIFLMVDSWELVEIKRGKFSRLLHKFVMFFVHSIIVPGKTGKSYFSRIYNRKNIGIVPFVLNYGHDIERTYQSIVYDICIVARLVPVKRVLESIDRLNYYGKERSTTLSVVLIGNGPLIEDVKRKINLSYHLSVTHVLSCGHNDCLKYIALSRFLYMPSSFEPWGLVVGEALSVGTPVLGSNKSAAVLDLIADKDNGFLFDIDEPHNEYNALVAALSLAPMEWKNMSDNALNSVSKFTIERSCRQFMKIIRAC